MSGEHARTDHEITEPCDLNINVLSERQVQDGLAVSRNAGWVRLACLLLLCLHNCTTMLTIKFNSTVHANDGLKSLNTVIIALVIIRVEQCMAEL